MIELVPYIIQTIIVIGGIAVGYGVMKNTVNTIKSDFDKHCDSNDKKFEHVYVRMNASENSLAGMKVDIGNIKSTMDKIDIKVDRLVSNLLGDK